MEAMEMMDVEMNTTTDRVAEVTGGCPANHEHPQQQRQDHHGNVRGLLAMARQLISQGKPSLALQAVIMAVKNAGGEEAVVQTLHRARELYRSKLEENVAADELASLFAECAIAEAQPLRAAEPPPPFDTGGGASMTMMSDIDDDETSILAESGRKHIMLDAFSDGSSFICLQCGGLVSHHRKEEHLAYWCCGHVLK